MSIHEATKSLTLSNSGEIRTLKRAISPLVLGLVLAGGSIAAIAPVSTHAAGMKPSVQITSASVSGKCITVKVKVNHFRLVKPVYVAPIAKLSGNQGHIHYTLNGHILPTRDATTSSRIPSADRPSS